MTVRIQLRRDLAATWLTVDPVLASGEPGVEKDTGKFKLGDGVSAWSGLAYAGGSGGDTAQTAIAGATISGDRAVAFDAGALVHCDKNDATLPFAYAGLSLNAANIGEVVRFEKVGIVTANFWTWSEGPVFLGTDGQLTQTPPTSGALLFIGWAIDATHLDLRPSAAIRRS